MIVLVLTVFGLTLLYCCDRGGMLTALLVLFVLMGSFAGYWSATMYKFFNGKMWKRSTFATALLFPSMIFAIFSALDIMVGLKDLPPAIGWSLLSNFKPANM